MKNAIDLVAEVEKELKRQLRGRGFRADANRLWRGAELSNCVVLERGRWNRPNKATIRVYLSVGWMCFSEFMGRSYDPKKPHRAMPTFAEDLGWSLIPSYPREWVLKDESSTNQALQEASKALESADDWFAHFSSPAAALEHLLGSDRLRWPMSTYRDAGLAWLYARLGDATSSENHLGALLRDEELIARVPDFGAWAREFEKKLCESVREFGNSGVG